MNKMNFLWVALALACFSCKNEAQKPAEKTTPPASSFTFSTWITYKPEKSDQAYRKEFQKFRENGISEILINTQADPEPLARIVPLAKEQNLKVHAWIMTVNRPDDKQALQHPQWYMVSREGKSCYDHRPYVDYYQWLCPTNPESKAHILSLVENLAQVPDIESVHLDYIRFPDIFLPIGLLPNYNLKQEEELPEFDFCYCDFCVNAFEKIHHKNPRTFQNPAIDMEWKQFRLNQIRNLVNEAYQIVHQHGKNLTAAVFPYPEMADHMVRQRWDKWHIDRVYPMIYHNFYNEENDWVGFATRQGLQDLEGKNTQLITGIYVPPLSPEDLKASILYAKENGATGVSLYDGNDLSPQQLQIIKEIANSK